MDQDSASKLTAMQNVIRNKFNQAYTNRLDHEHNVNQVMKSLNTFTPSTDTLTSDSESKEDDFSPRNLSKTSSKNHVDQMQLSTKINSKLTIESSAVDPNELCISLRKLLSSQIVDNVDRTHEINSITEQLRKLEIII